MNYSLIDQNFQTDFILKSNLTRGFPRVGYAFVPVYPIWQRAALSIILICIAKDGKDDEAL